MLPFNETTVETLSKALSEKPQALLPLAIAMRDPVSKAYLTDLMGRATLRYIAAMCARGAALSSEVVHTVALLFAPLRLVPHVRTERSCLTTFHFSLRVQGRREGIADTKVSVDVLLTFDS